MAKVRISDLSNILSAFDKDVYIAVDNKNQGTRKMSLGKLYPQTGGELSGSIVFTQNSNTGLDGDTNHVKYNGKPLVQTINGTLSANTYGNLEITIPKLSVMTESEYSRITVKETDVFYFIKD